ncbi:MAG: hypothetical protein ACAH83_05305 [Alphaproteobacteria bacterium]
MARRKDDDIPMPDFNPDFRHMTVKDLRRGMSEINRTIKTVRENRGPDADAMHDLETLRARFKMVWRARPGRAFHDVAARKKREAKRRRDSGLDFGFPFGP